MPQAVANVPAAAWRAKNRQKSGGTLFDVALYLIIVGFESALNRNACRRNPNLFWIDSIQFPDAFPDHSGQPWPSKKGTQLSLSFRPGSARIRESQARPGAGQGNDPQGGGDDPGKLEARSWMASTSLEPQSVHSLLVSAS